MAGMMPPTPIYYMQHARAGLVHDPRGYNWSACVYPRADSLICKRMLSIPVFAANLQKLDVGLEADADHVYLQPVQVPLPLCWRAGGSKKLIAAKFEA